MKLVKIMMTKVMMMTMIVKMMMMVVIMETLNMIETVMMVTLMTSHPEGFWLNWFWVGFISTISRHPR